MTEEFVNEMLVDMINSGELELGWNRDIFDFRMVYFKENTILGGIGCELVYIEFSKEFYKSIHISKETIDNYIMNKRDDIINNLLN